MATVDSPINTDRSKRKRSVLPTPDSTGEGQATPSRKLKPASSFQDTKMEDALPESLFAVVPLKVSVPKEEANCKLSDNLADSVRTMCKVCGVAVTLTGMRGHTKITHQLQITRYKELHGPFEIIEHVFHKCHLCGKILLLDSDAMGGHIKGTHKMKESDYKERFMNYSDRFRGRVKEQSKNSSKEANNLPSSKPVYDFKTTFPDYEYSCNLKHCELCEREGVNVSVDNNNSAVKSELKNSENNSEPDLGLDNDEELSAFDDDVEKLLVSECKHHGQGGWSKTFLNSDILDTAAGLQTSNLSSSTLLPSLVLEYLQQLCNNQNLAVQFQTEHKFIAINLDCFLGLSDLLDCMNEAERLNGGEQTWESTVHSMVWGYLCTDAPVTAQMFTKKFRVKKLQLSLQSFVKICIAERGDSYPPPAQKFDNSFFLPQQPHSDINNNLVDPHASPAARTSRWTVQDIITPCVIFSGLDRRTRLQLSGIVTSLGGMVTDQPRNCTHLVMDRLARTNKFLMSLPLVKFVLGVKWVVESGESGRWISEKRHMLTDPTMERTFNFSLAKTLAMSTRDKLFIGKVFYITPSVIPSINILTEIIINSGGSVENSRITAEKLAEINNDGCVNYIILTCDEDIDMVSDVLRAKQGVYTAEFVMSAVTRGDMDFGQSNYLTYM